MICTNDTVSILNPRVLRPRDLLPKGEVVKPRTGSTAQSRATHSPSMLQLGILQERVAVEKDERDQVDTVKAHGKEANAADSDLQQLIAHEI